MAIDKKKEVIVNLGNIPTYKSQTNQIRGKILPGNNKSIIMSKLVTRLPKYNWRSESRKITLHHEVDVFAKKTKDNFITLLITIVGMATALTWNEVVRSIIDTLFVDRSAFYVKLYVAVIATIFTLVTTYMISRIYNKNRK
jgi:hypothetical protein